MVYFPVIFKDDDRTFGMVRFVISIAFDEEINTWLGLSSARFFCDGDGGIFLTIFSCIRFSLPVLLFSAVSLYPCIVIRMIWVHVVNERGRKFVLEEFCGDERCMRNQFGCLRTNKRGDKGVAREEDVLHELS